MIAPLSTFHRELRFHSTQIPLPQNPKNLHRKFSQKMENKHKFILIIALPTSFLLLILAITIYFCARKSSSSDGSRDIEATSVCKEGYDEEIEGNEDLIRFQGGEDLTAYDILDAPGEVIGKSGYGTLYRASLVRNDCVMLLRFLRPACAVRMKEVVPVVHLLGSIRHPNLVPLWAFYAGSRGEKLLVHPFYRRGSLSQFIADGTGESHKWTIIYKISIGIARALDHLHTGQQNPVIHGNLKSRNILLGRNYQPHVSDFGLHLLLNPTAAQEMLEASADEGYKAPELIKMKDVSEETDIYSFGVILLELLTGKEPINEKPTPDEDFHLPTSLRNAVLDHRISDLYHPDILVGENNKGESPVNEEQILKFFQLAMACCSPAPSLRPNIKQILENLQEI